MLKNENSTLIDTSLRNRVSSTSRLHDLFIKIEGMTPGEFKNGGKNLTINYCCEESPFGKIIVGSTNKGICHMSFEEDEQKAFYDLSCRFPNAKYQETTDESQKNALHIFQDNWKHLDEIKLHLKGTDFQLKVWETLLKVPTKENLLLMGNS